MSYRASLLGLCILTCTSLYSCLLSRNPFVLGIVFHSGHNGLESATSGLDGTFRGRIGKFKDTFPNNGHKGIAPKGGDLVSNGLFYSSPRLSFVYSRQSREIRLDESHTSRCSLSDSVLDDIEDERSDYRASKLVDFCKIKAIGGDGGDGCLSFRREKHVPLGGANGGNGGPGGSVYIHCDETLSNLNHIDQFYIYKAKDGQNGLGSQRNGAKGEDLDIFVPSGTVVHGENGEVFGTLLRKGDKIRIARGGRGGKGNKYFMSKLNNAPKMCERGERGICRVVSLVYKIPGDIALIGRPNSGKSSILKSLTRARPKIADYPFSTISPVHGVMDYDSTLVHEDESVDGACAHKEISSENGDSERMGRMINMDSVENDEMGDDELFGVVDDGEEVPKRGRLVIADVPGLISGAHEGRGLGHDFLKHIERCQVLAYVVDISAEDPLEEYNAVKEEIGFYDDELLSRMSIVLLNKMDLVDSDRVATILNSFIKHCNHDRIYPISAKTLENLDTVKPILAKLHHDTPVPCVDTVPIVSELDNFRRLNPRNFKIAKVGEGEFTIESPYLERKVAMLRFDLPETLERLRGMLKRAKIQSKLVKAGVVPGDTVHIGELSFSVSPNLVM